MLRQNADADLPGRDANGEGEDDRSLIAIGHQNPIAQPATACQIEFRLIQRMDKATAEKGYAGPVLVCSLRYEPIAGHSASNTLVKYVSEGREMEIALAPIAGTRWLAPFRLSIGSTLANLVIEANRFEADARTEAPFTNPKAQ